MRHSFHCAETGIRDSERDPSVTHLQLGCVRGEQVGFYRPNCGACRSLHPKLEQLATEYSDRLVLLKVDTRLDEGVFAMSKRLSVEKVPYFQVG
jgi:thiol-disulfide isomerase/thioredoxin